MLDYVPSNLYGIRYLDKNDRQIKLASIFAQNEAEARRIWESMGPPHEPNFDILGAEEAKELAKIMNESNNEE